jgi:hypothetical protein
MITASWMVYSGYKMKYEYLVAIEQEQSLRGVETPIDFGEISAPETICAGSHYSYELRPGLWSPLCRGTRRQS